MASGSGTNAQKIIEYFLDKPFIEVTIVLSNNQKAFVLDRARQFNLPVRVFTKQDFYHSDTIIDLLKSYEIDLLVLAGFLWLIPEKLLKVFSQKIINIHPALLPKYGGKGMYGMKVHEAIKANNERETGITIHYVNEKYDEGEILFQATCKIEEEDTPEVIAQKVHQLEHGHYPKIIEKLLI